MNHDHYGAMKRLILSCMILVPVIPFILILGIGYHYFTSALETGTISSMHRIVGDHSHMIESFLRERKADLGFILRSYTFEELSRPEILDKVFNNLQQESNAFVDLGIFNESGVHAAYQGPFELTGKVYKQADWFKEVTKKGYYISDVFLGYRRVPHFVIAMAKNEESKSWIIRATIDTYMFNDLVKKVRIGKTGEAYILNRGGIFQTEQRSGGSLLDKDPDQIRYAMPDVGTKTFIIKDARGEEYVYATTWLKDREWLLVVRQEKADAFKALRSAAFLIILIIVVGGSAIVGVASYLTDRIVRRMEHIDAEKEELSQQLIGASRLAELGEMAAGFAHEINNPLQIIRTEETLIDTILSDLKERGELKESQDLTEIEDSSAQIKLQIDRCAEITQAILKFGRQNETVVEDMDLSSFISEVTALIEKKATVHGIAVKQDIRQDTPLIHGDPTQLQQVLLNLFNNAIDAIVAKHGSEGGEMAIGARPGENGKVEIFVTDNGCGISQENLKKVFTPFFTTKPIGKGTGLGLSVCYGIVEKMGGVMEVSTEQGVGTTFKISLPAAR